jgi:hypothetical protein
MRARRAWAGRLAAAVAAAAALGASGLACHDLPGLGTCGNGLAEAELGEACDGDVGGADTCTATCQLACQSAAVTAAYVAVGRDPATGAEQYCPDARMRCGLEGTCRAPSGAFRAPGLPHPFDVRAAAAGDADGDLIDDLVGSSATQLAARFGASREPFVDGVIQEAPSSESPPQLYDRRPDAVTPGVSDLALAVPTDGLAILSSDTESFKPELDVTLPIDASALSVIVTDPAPGVGDVFLEVAREGAAGLVVRRTAVPPLLAGLTLPGTCGGGGARLVEVAVARDRASFVVVGRTATGAGWYACRYTASGAAFGPPAITAFPGAPPPDWAVLADVDGDACAELVTGRYEPPPVGLTTFSYAAAGGGSCALTGALTELGQDRLSGTVALLDAGRLLDGTSREQLATAAGVYQIQPGSPTKLALIAAPTAPGRPWSSAAVVDLNGDGRLDLVAGRVQQDDVDVVRGGAAPTVYRADTAGIIEQVVAGDFDGDGLGDAALVEGSGAGARLAFLYGTGSGLAGPARAASTFGAPLVIARLGRYGWGYATRARDGIDDLAVVRVAAGVARGGVVLGDAPRIPTLPRLPPPAGGGIAEIGAVAVGKLDGARLLAATLAPGSDASIPRVHDLAAGTWGPEVQLGTFDADLARAPTVLRRAGAPLVATVARPRAPGAAPTLGAFDLAGRVCTGTPKGPVLALDAVDLLGDDGVDELVVTTGSLTAGDRAVSVIPVAPGAPCQLGAEQLGAALARCVDVARAGATIVALCELSARRYGLFRVTGGAREAEPFAEVDGLGTQLIPGDFDGDGVTDLAVGVARGLEVNVQFVAQCPAHDVRGCR